MALQSLTFQFPNKAHHLQLKLTLIDCQQSQQYDHIFSSASASTLPFFFFLSQLRRLKNTSIFSQHYRKFYHDKPKIHNASQLHKEEILPKHKMPEFILKFHVLNFYLHVKETELLPSQAGVQTTANSMQLEYTSFQSSK